MERLEEFHRILAGGRADLHTACQIFDACETVDLESLIGTWRGEEFHTGHPLDGVLKKLNWYGKAFHDAENVDPLLFEGKHGDVFAVDPVPVMDKRKLIKAAGGKARMRMMEFRGRTTATMIYDNLPIHDHFRKVQDGLLFCMMDWKGDKQPYFFLLNKVK
ncbi:DUF4334 domain-containing protein [Planococcus sp. N028]|uniref:DUF4334 domain-containing protein n=1 Tax=Planococcus shixiaomingii TaxID=3058393 RepID=A0ABT8N2F0_9BACL|nr:MULTISPECIES: DUF4334 domain-containing protein [unclassified Planococcus (in: firmicutes)]MDN7242069.1 DUF4334 domain-containing protein [Planococcus sp. N028]WKA54344.1 DUF4334 domain-containing protein [Planococcus sp. N022]